MIQSAPYRFVASLVFSFAAIIAYFAGYSGAAIALSWLGMASYVPYFSRGSSLSVLAFVLSSTLSAFFVHLKFGYRYPLQLTGVYLMAIAASIRLIAYRQLNRGSAFWLEFMLAGPALLLYLLQQVLEPQNWLAWVYPLPPLFISLGTVIGSTLDRIKLADFARKGYGIRLGEPAPDFSLPDESGNIISLSSFKGQHHVLIIFYRGDWCPYCHIMLRTYNRHAQEFKSRNIQLLAVGPDDPGATRALVELMGLDYHVLTDAEMSTVRSYGINIDGLNPNGAPQFSQGSPLPASFLVDIHGILRFSSHPERVGEFLEPERIFPVLAKL